MTGALLLAGVAAPMAKANVYTTQSINNGTVQNNWHNVSIGSGSSDVELVVSGSVSEGDIIPPDGSGSGEVAITVSEQFSPGTQFQLNVNGTASPYGSYTSKENTYTSLPSGQYDIEEVTYATPLYSYVPYIDSSAEVEFTW